MKLFNLLLLFSCLVFAQQGAGIQEEPVKSEKDIILEEINSLSAKDSDELADKLNELSAKVVEYAQIRKKQCSGEYSTIEITPEGESKKVVNKLSKEEKKLCMINLVQMRKKFTKSLYKARKKLLLAQHKEELLNLENSEKESLRELDELAASLK